MKSLSFLFLLPLLLARPASGETVIGTPITKVPVTITRPGIYRLSKGLSFLPTSGAAITIDASQVVLDLNGYELACASGTNNAASGIATSGAQSRITIQDGSVVGFANAVALNATVVTVSHIQAVSTLFKGIYVNGNHVRIVGNQVINTGGGNPSNPLAIVGIELTGTYGEICDNEIQTVITPDAANRFAAGIRLASCSFDVVKNNRVSSVLPTAPANASVTGIYAQSDDDLVVLGNTVDATDNGFDFTGTTAGKYGENITVGIAGSAYIPGGMTDLGTNN